ncbi:MAG: PAS domain S-box protein [bacterium]
MDPGRKRKARLILRGPELAALLAALLGLTVLTGWYAGLEWLTTLVRVRVPMAPSTAFLFLLLGTTALLLSRASPSDRTQRGWAVLLSAAAGLALALLVLSLLGIELDLEHPGLTPPGPLGGVPIDHMSPLTAFGFLLAGTALLLLLLSRQRRVRTLRAASLTASVLVGMGAVLLLAYLLGGSLLYDSGIIPPPLPTVLGFLLLGGGILTWTGERLVVGTEGEEGGGVRIPPLLILVFGLIAAGIISIALISFRIQERDYRTIAENQLAGMAYVKAVEIGEWRRERLGDAEVFFRNELFAETLGLLAARPEDPAVRGRIMRWMQRVQEVFRYDRISLWSEEGDELIAVPDTSSPPGRILRAAVRDPAHRTETHFLDLYREEGTVRPYLAILAPVQVPGSDPGGPGMISLRLDPGIHLYPMLHRWRNFTETGETLLVRREGEDVLFLNDLRFDSDAALQRRIPLERSELPAAMAVRGAEGIVTGTDYRGVRVAAAVRSIPDSPWHLVTRMDTREIYAPLRDRLWNVVLMVAVMLIGVGTVLWAVWQRRGKLYYRELYQAERSLQESESRYRALFHSIRDAILVTDTDRRIIDCNTAFTELFGYELEEIRGRPTADLYDDEEVFREMGAKLRENIGRPGFLYTIDYRTRSGRVFPGETSTFYLTDEQGEVIGFIGVIRDVSGEQEAARALTESERRYREIFEKAPVGIFVTDSTGRVHTVNPAMARILGVDSAEEAREHFTDVARQLYTDPERRAEFLQRLETEGHVSRFEYEARRADGECIWLEMSARITGQVPSGGFLIEGFVTEVTDRRRAEEERKRLQQQLLQVQRMESVGRLAGGVAHDFNNMLSVILGHVEMALAGEVGEHDPLHRRLDEIRNATERSMALTGQLLAFARKQTIRPQVLDLNDTVEGMLKMLRRLIGEDIELAWMPDEDLWQVKLDPAQIDQMLANLLVNARDAIAGVGKVTIGTENVTIDEDYAREHPGFLPGEYVMLAVSDDGSGMEPEVVEQIFDPFFTTKSLGEGTGLGMATVFGVVKQNEGFINVYSEPGEGTTFRIYLPRFTGTVPEKKDDPVEAPLPGGDETILVVEDNASVLDLSREILQKKGYTVLAVNEAPAALERAREYQGAIDLLLTDVVMPQMNGRKLSEHIRALHPDIKVLFMSGYTADVIAHRGILDKGVHYIQKPFSSWALAEKVRSVLDLQQSAGPHRP